MWGSQCVQYRGPRNVGLCRDTEVGEGIIPDPASSRVLENDLAWPTEVSPCVPQPKGRQGTTSKFPLRNNSNCACPDAPPLSVSQFRMTCRKLTAEPSKCSNG